MPVKLASFDVYKITCITVLKFFDQRKLLDPVDVFFKIINQNQMHNDPSGNDTGLSLCNYEASPADYQQGKCKLTNILVEGGQA